MDNGQFPNFTLTSTRMWENQFDEAKLDIQVERDLRVTVKPAKPTVGPGESVELEVTTVDQLGRPVSAELSIAMIDQSLLRLFNDRLPEIGSFFYNQTRTGAFATQATNIFRYQPNTTGVPQAIVDDAERSGGDGRQCGGSGGSLAERRSPGHRRHPGRRSRELFAESGYTACEFPCRAAIARGGPAEHRDFDKQPTFAAVNPESSRFARLGQNQPGRTMGLDANAPAESSLKEKQELFANAISGKDDSKSRPSFEDRLGRRGARSNRVSVSSNRPTGTPAS